MRVIVADYHIQVRKALVAMLSTQPEITLVMEATDALELVCMGAIHAPDLVLLDIDLPGARLRETITELHLLERAPFIIVISTRAEESREALAAGADMFVSKSDGSDWLLARLRDYTRQRSGLRKGRPLV